MRKVGDPVADKPIAKVLERGGVDEVNKVMHKLVRFDQPVPAELPDELEEYLANSPALPEWADMDRIERGQQVFETWGLHIALCLFCASLPSSYAAAKGVQVLDLTARLVTDPKRRIGETGQFLLDVCNVGGLDDRGKGRRTSQKVRLMHAAVRHLIEAGARQTPGLWNPDWDKPLNQEDLAGTRMAFAGVVADPMRRLGVRLPDKDIDAYLHLWNVIGHLLGIDDKLLVLGLDDAIALVDVIRRRQFRASDAGRRLTAALLELLYEMTPGRQFDGIQPALIRHLIGEETADMIGVPGSGRVAELGRLTRTVDWFFVHVLGHSERESPGYHLMSEAARPFARELLKTLVMLPRGGERAPFDIPDHLARRWEIPA
jgi:hypothetical protein